MALMYNSYMEQIRWKLYIYITLIVISIFFGLIFFYKWYTKPKLAEYCGKFNSFSCKVGKCDYISHYKTGDVGYCRNTLLGF